MPLEQEKKLTGGRVNYYLAVVDHPDREEQAPYIAECTDIIDALQLTFAEANIFKEIWRTANARLNNGKPGHTALYGAEKVAYYANRNLRQLQRELASQNTVEIPVSEAIAASVRKADSTL